MVSDNLVSGWSRLSWEVFPDGRFDPAPHLVLERKCVDMERTGESGESCGVPVVKSMGSYVLPLNLSLTVRSLRKDLPVHHLTSSGRSLDLRMFVLDVRG